MAKNGSVEISGRSVMWGDVMELMERLNIRFAPKEVGEKKKGKEGEAENCKT